MGIAYSHVINPRDRQVEASKQVATSQMRLCLSPDELFEFMGAGGKVNRKQRAKVLRMTRREINNGVPAARKQRD